MSVTTAPQALVIEGGNELNGRIRASGNKNGALPILAACLLADEPVTLANVPRIRDVETMIDLICATGASAEWTGPNEVRVEPQGLSSPEVDAVLAERIRASFLLAGPLLARLGRASVPPPGGDVIGRRRLDPHIHALQRLGTRIQVENRYEMETDGLRGAEIFLAAGGARRQRPRAPTARGLGAPTPRGRRGSEARGGPVAASPRRPAADPGRSRAGGWGAAPNLGEDVGEPPVLRRQARLDGCADHRL